MADNFDNYSMKVQARVDLPSNKDIDAQIRKLEKSISKLKVSGQFDDTALRNLTNQLNTLKASITTANFSPTALTELTNQVNRALQNINIGNINVGGVGNQAQQVGQQIGNNIAQGVASGVGKATTTVKSFSALMDSMKSQKVELNTEGLIDDKKTLDAIKQTYSEFGQVKITNKVFDAGQLQSFKVNIEQVNGELKETRTFMMKLSESGKFFVFPDDTIKGTEKYVQHLNAAKNATNATGEALNAQNQRLAEQAKYYGKIKEETNHLYSLKQKLLSADELQTAELNKQIKSTKQRITYNNQQLDKKGLRDNSLEREINDLVVAREKQLALSDAKAQDTANTKAQAQAQREANAVLKEQQALQEQVNKIQLSWEDGTYEAKYDSLIAKTRQWVNANDESVISTQKLTTAYNEFNTAASNFAKDGSVKNRDILLQKEEELGRQLKATTNDIKVQNAEFAKSSKVDSLHQKIQEFYDKNTATHRTWGSQLKNMLNETAHGAQITATRVNEIEQEFLGVSNAARQAGKLGQSFFGGIKEQASKFIGWFSVTSVVMEGVQSIKKMAQAVIEVDTAMIELTKVSSASSNELKNYFDEAAESAKKLGASVSDVISATADFSRLGYNLKDASVLAEVATLYKNVGDGITIDEASSSIVSTMKAFGIEAENAMQIIDAFNQVGNNFAISSGEIGDALKRSASSLAVGGNSLSEAIGLITAGNTVVQDADIVGTALKSMSLRITSTSAELEAMGEDTEFACETLSDYRDLVMGLTDNKVNIVGDDGEYKSTYEILKDISQVWNDMNSMEQSSLMKALFGVRQANIGASILENFDVAEQAMKSAEESAGSALKEQSNYEKGVQFSLDRLSASWQEFSNHFLDSSFIKGIVDFGNTTINVIDDVNSALGSLGSISLGAGLFAGVKNFGKTYKCMVSNRNCFEYALHA